jgi:hypothetical protein
MCGLRTGQNHVRSTTFGWIDESGIASKFCRQRRAKPSRSPNRVARVDFEEAVKLRLGRIITLRQKTLRLPVPAPSAVPAEQGALSEALCFYKIPGPGSSREVEATGPTKCIARASTIGSIQGEARAVRYSLCMLRTISRSQVSQGRFPRWLPYAVNFVRFGS